MNSPAAAGHEAAPQVRVSIIMPFLNTQRFITEAIESVLAQTFTDWELLLIDDGSTDGSSGIAAYFQSQHPLRIRILTHQGGGNRGASASRNLGIAHARGEWIAMLDADDLWLPHKLEQQMLLLDAHPQVDFLYGNTLWWYGWTGLPPDEARDRVPPLGFPPNTIVPPPQLLARFMSGRAAVPATCSVLVRRALVERTGGFEENFRYIFTDHVFYTKVLLEATAMVTDGCWDIYRRHPASSYSTVESSGEFDAKRQAWLHWTRDYLASKGLQQSDLWHVLQFQLWRYRQPRGFAFRRTLRKMPSNAKRALKRLAKGLLPSGVRRRLRHSVMPRWRPKPHEVNFGSLGRVTPIRRLFDPPRGTSIALHYVLEFMRRHATDLGDRVLELGIDRDDFLSGQSTGRTADWLPEDGAQLQRRLSEAPDGSADTILQWGGHADLHAALSESLRVLRPGGVLLAAFPAIGSYGGGEAAHGHGGAVTPRQLRRAAEAVFGTERVLIEAAGNVLAACASLHGLAAEELNPEQLAFRDPAYPVVVLLRAVKMVGES